MSARVLPARPNLDHLKHEAKALQKAFGQGERSAVDRVRAVLADRSALKLVDAQRVIAREYGFPSWTRLRAHVLSVRVPADGVNAFLVAVQEQDRAAALRVLHANPQLPSESLAVAAVLGLAAEIRRLIADDPARVTTRAGDESPAEPLLWLCFSPFHGENATRDAGLLDAARLLLGAGADPNARDARHGVPALYAVTGQRSVLPVARLLLSAGANPTDGESIFHAAERFHEGALELLLSAGADLNFVGDWGNTALYFLLQLWDVAREPRVRQGFAWLLAHGADPDVRSGKEQESALHAAARRGQDVPIVQLLLDHGADVHASRADGSTAWLLARRGGFDEIASLLERAGAKTRPLSPLELLLAACGRGDVDIARRLASPALLDALEPADRIVLPEAAMNGRETTVIACLAARFPVDTVDSSGATALHHAALRGRATMIRALLDAHADLNIRDSEHRSTPLGWALFGADFVADASGNYEESVRALLDAGAHPRADEHHPAHAGVRALLQASTLHGRATGA